MAVSTCSLALTENYKFPGLLRTSETGEGRGRASDPSVPTSVCPQATTRIPELMCLCVCVCVFRVGGNGAR